MLCSTLYARCTPTYTISYTHHTLLIPYIYYVDGMIVTPPPTHATKTNISMSTLLRIQSQSQSHTTTHASQHIFVPGLLPIDVEGDSRSLLNSIYPCYLPTIHLGNNTGTVTVTETRFKQLQCSGLDSMCVCLSMLRLVVCTIYFEVHP